MAFTSESQAMLTPTLPELRAQRPSVPGNLSVEGSDIFGGKEMLWGQ